jgi:hypothetical protein
VSNAQLTVSILEGKGTGMPTFSGKLNKDQISDLIAYVRSFGPIKGPTTKFQEGEFQQRYHELEAQWNELERQLQMLKNPTKQ